MVAINERVNLSKGRHAFLATFMKAVSKCNQDIYRGAIDECCFPPDGELFEDNPVIYSDSTSSKVTAGIQNKVIVIDETSPGAILGRANGKFSSNSEMTPILGRANDDSPREPTEARRSRSMRRSISASHYQMISWFGKSRSMGRGKDKELTRSSRPMRRSRTKSPRRTRSPGRAPSQPRQSASTQRKSRTSKREGSGKSKSEAAPPTAKHRDEPLAMIPATRVSSTRIGRAGGKSSKNKSEVPRTKLPHRSVFE
jgi:hypothetical protein